MKKNVLLMLFGIIILFTGCSDDDGYSLNNAWIGFGMLEQVNPDPLEYRIIMDNGDVLIPVASGYQYPWFYYGTNNPDSILKAGDRILLYYTVLGVETGDDESIEQYYIRVNAVNQVLLKNILDITEENQDSIGNDPVIVKKIWMKDSLLNFEIKYYGRYEIHYINLVKEPGELTEADQPIQLELRHNDNGDLKDIPYSAYVSFNLDAIQVAGLDSVQFVVTSTDYEGNVDEYDGVYHYGSDD